MSAKVQERLPPPMTKKQRQFVDAYLGEAARDAGRAAELAGYSSPEKVGPRLLRHPKVRRHLPAEVTTSVPEAAARAEAEPPEIADSYEAFVLAYIGEARFNATRAARAAGYASASSSARHLLRRPEIRARINEYLAATAMSAQEVLAQLAEVARRGLDECIEVRGAGKGMTARMDASAKMKALELLGKTHGLFTERVHHSGTLTREYVIVRDEGAE
jgi:phage terminase small subunit